MSCGSSRPTSAPGAPTLLTLSYSELAASLDRVEGLLGPDAIRRNFPHVQIETGPPLGPGLRSFARIASGYAEVDVDSQGSAFLSEFTFSFCDGSVERAEQGGLVARLVIRSPLASVNRLNEVLRANELILFSEADALSTNAANPSRFSGTTTVLIPKGTWLGFAGAGVTLPDHLACEMLSEIRGHLHGHRFAGRFRQTHRYSGVPGLPNEISTSGRFEAWLA